MKKMGFYITLFCVMASCLFLSVGCTKKPNLQELQQLEEQRRSINEQEKKLLELKAEREKLEAALEVKKVELRKLETERDSLKSRLGQ